MHKTILVKSRHSCCVYINMTIESFISWFDYCCCCFNCCFTKKIKTLKKIWLKGKKKVDSEFEIFGLVKSMRELKYFLNYSMVTEDIRYRINHS